MKRYIYQCLCYPHTFFLDVQTIYLDVDQTESISTKISPYLIMIKATTFVTAIYNKFLTLI
jgi:hypothetical protein